MSEAKWKFWLERKGQETTLFVQRVGDDGYSGFPISADHMESLGKEFEWVLFDNAWALYAR